MEGMEIRTLRLSGGEPTLHPDFPAIIAEASRSQLQVSLNTNGLFPRYLKDIIVDLPIDRFIVSIDGLKKCNDEIRGIGTFEKIIKTVSSLKKHGCNVTLGVHLQKSNLNDIPGLIKLSVDLGVAIKFSPVRPMGRARGNLNDCILDSKGLYQAVRAITRVREYYQQHQIITDFDILRPLHKDGEAPLLFDACPAGRSIMNVNFDGYVYPCVFLATEDREFAAGHISNESLITLWASAPIFLELRTMTKDRACQECFAFRRLCAGGCPAMSYYSSGRLQAHDPQCFIQLLSPSKS